MNRPLPHGHAAPDAATAPGPAALQDRLRQDMRALMLPAANWVPPRHGPQGAAVSDVVVIGDGMCWLAPRLH